MPELSRKFKKSIVDPKTFDHKDYRDQYLGTYFQTQFGESVIPKGLKAESGTLATYYKNRLAEISSNKIFWDNMSQEAKELTKSIYGYILNQNPQLSN